MAEEYSYQSVYNFSENRVIDAFELEGLEKISIHSQSFAPFPYFGYVPPFGPFIGDNRTTFQADPNASSRISGRIDLNLSGDGISQIGQDQRGSISLDLTLNRVARSDAKLISNIGEGISDGTTAASTLNFSLFGNNSLVPGSPDIDVKGRLGLGVFENADGTSTALISGEIFGDKFPSNETFVTDASGNAVFLGVSGAIFGPNAGPAFALPGDNNRSMSGFRIYLNFDAEGNISDIEFNGQNFTIEEWNKQFQNLNPQSGNTSTNFD